MRKTFAERFENWLGFERRPLFTITIGHKSITVVSSMFVSLVGSALFLGLCVHVILPLVYPVIGWCADAFMSILGIG
jgi:hypothetical protein